MSMEPVVRCACTLGRSVESISTVEEREVDDGTTEGCGEEGCAMPRTQQIAEQATNSAALISPMTPFPGFRACVGHELFGKAHSMGEWLSLVRRNLCGAGGKSRAVFRLSLRWSKSTTVVGLLTAQY